MPKEFADHEANRLKVCAPCGRKVVFGSKKPSFFKISEQDQKLIKNHVDNSFDRDDSKFPLAWCNTCRNTVKEYERGITNRPQIKMPNYEDLQLQKETRQEKGPCNCYICLTGRSNIHLKADLGKGHKRKFETELNKNNGLYASPSTEKSFNSLNPKAPKSSEKKNIQICKICWGEVGKGVFHECNKENVLVNNLQNIVMQFPEKVKDKVLLSILKEKTQNNELLNSSGTKQFKLHNGGRHKTTLIQNPEKSEKVVFTAEKLDNLQNNMGLPSNKMRIMENFIRCNAGKKAIPKNYRVHAIEKGKVLKDLYKSCSHVFDVEGPNDKDVRPIVYADCEELLEAVVDFRNLEGNFYIKVMADSGQGFFKISMSLFTKNEYEDVSDVSTPVKRSKYLEGGTAGKSASWTSVKKIIILCIVPKIKESYDNLLYLCNLINLNNVPFKFASDLKLLLIVNGQQTASSSFPCPYCFISLQNLKKGCKEFVDVDDLVVMSLSKLSSEESGIVGEMKTYGGLRRDYKKYVLLGETKKIAKNCHSTVNEPIFQEHDDLKVIEKCVVPELHLLQGFVNHLFWKGLVPLLGREKALIWPKKLNVVPKNYQGEIFEGNACRKLLKNADKLYDREIVHGAMQLRIEPFVKSFKIMNEIVHNCFSVVRKENVDLGTSIEELKKAFDATDVSESLKVHIILNHLLQCLACLGDNDGLGLWSEQPGESIHREFLVYWNRYKVNSMADPSYVLQLQKAVVEFSSRHL